MNTGKDAHQTEARIEKLQDANRVVRMHTATLLGFLDDDAEPAVPALIELLQKVNMHDRRIAGLTLGEIGLAPLGNYEIRTTAGYFVVVETEAGYNLWMDHPCLTTPV